MTATLPPSIKFQPLVGGAPLPGGKVKFYQAGTTTPQEVYDEDGTTPIGTELTLDANGATSFRLGDALTYKIELYDSNDVLQLNWPEDNVRGSGSALASAKAYTDALKADFATTGTGKGAEMVGYLAPYTGAVARTQNAKNSDIVNFKDLGGVCDGVTDDTAALLAADAECILKKKTLYISGTPLIKSALTFTGLSSWVMEGAGGNTGSNKPTSYFIKHSSVLGDLFTFTGNNPELVNIGVLGQVGNTGDGIVIHGNGARIIRPWVAYMGNDGIRIGKTAGGINANSFYIEAPRCFNNVRDGINVDDYPAGASNANAGLIMIPVCLSNGRHGIYMGNTYLGTTIITPSLEANTGYGLYLDTLCRMAVVTGGDIEANTAGNLYESVKFYNEITGVSVAGKVISRRAQHGTWIPAFSGGTTFNITASVADNVLTVTTTAGVISIGQILSGAGSGLTGCYITGQLTGSAGSTGTYSISGSHLTIASGAMTLTSGVGTYSVQEGYYEIAGGSCNFRARIIASAHTGTGQLYINLPMPVCETSGVPSLFPCELISDATALPAGAQSKGLISGPGKHVRTYYANAGVVSSFPIGACAIYVSGSFPLPQPNFYLV